MTDSHEFAVTLGNRAPLIGGRSRLNPRRPIAKPCLTTIFHISEMGARQSSLALEASPTIVREQGIAGSVLQSGSVPNTAKRPR